MKKIYMQPAMLVVKTNAAKMICVSRFNENLNTTGGDGGSACTKRRRGIFQDDAIEEDQSIW